MLPLHSEALSLFALATCPNPQEAVNTVFSAADVFAAIYPEDLFPHPATFYQAMASGCAVLATPFKAALAHLPSNAGTLVWDRSPEVLARQLLATVAVPELVAEMQHAAWKASVEFSWARAADKLLRDVFPPWLLH